MEVDNFSGSNYRGTKDFTQHDVSSANATGFGAAADDYMERGIDLNEQLVMNKPATFFFRMKGDAMTEAGIYNNNVLIVDRSVKASHGKIVVAIVDGEMMVRRLQKTFNKTILLAENERFKPIELNEFTTSMVWGVVTCNINIVDDVLWMYLNNRKVNGQ
ncbi:LexA family transcriptional regulator [Ferruginibacter sp. HRS2-29]|uniref:LexA family protein n=1 Tax=Ferruginibacter sp. HRS2-29 TaxID=2487334 RepID=UPI0020CEB17D|nr:translesion error-prone DNA polymerase V autoproteolytic subunit [Ferruginibacter sp. HRS2-29]MCP9749953.1 LexA family transcriptional regulator [Ferruginibacter sp. HRS2-29]